MSERLSQRSRFELGPDASMLGSEDTVAVYPAPDEMSRRQILTEVRKNILSEPYFERSDVEFLLGGLIGATTIEELIADGTLLAYADHGDHLFPTFQFDFQTHRPLKVVSRINIILEAPDDGWGVTAWWIQPHAMMPNHTAPKELLGDRNFDSSLVLMAESVLI